MSVLNLWAKSQFLVLLNSWISNEPDWLWYGGMSDEGGGGEYEVELWRNGWVHGWVKGERGNWREIMGMSEGTNEQEEEEGRTMIKTERQGVWRAKTDGQITVCVCRIDEGWRYLRCDLFAYPKKNHRNE